MLKMRDLKLSNRLLTCAGMVSSGAIIADIGTDHAYIPIYLALKNKIKSALACDVRVGPLENAKNNIKYYKLENIIKTRLSDGLENIDSDEVNEIIIAGMGANIIIKILENCTWKNKHTKRFIIQPMKYEDKLRVYFAQNGYEIKTEEAVVCCGKVYTVMDVKFTGKPYEVEDKQIYIGKLYENISPDAKVYIQKQINGLENRKKGALAKNLINEANRYGIIIENLKNLLV